MGYVSLQHIQDSMIHLTRALPTRYVPSSRFGYLPDGLLPSNPGRFCFAPAALLGFTLRSVHLRQGISSVTVEMSPPTVCPAVTPDAEASGRPGGPQFLGFDPCRSSWSTPMVLAWRPLVAPLGFALPGYFSEDLHTDFAAFPLTCLPAPAGRCLAALQSFNQSSPGSPAHTASRIRSG